MDIKDSVIVITGGAIRVGRSIALHLAEKGAHIAFTYYGADEEWEKTKSDIENKGVKCFVRQVDVKDVEQIRSFIDETKRQFGRLDGLINNAGLWLRDPVMQISEADWDDAMKVNLKAPFFTSQAAAAVMKESSGGCIINITDISAFQVWPEYTHHATSKSGLITITKYMASELAPDVRVNAVAFGTILLPPGATKEKEEWCQSNSLLKKIGSPEEAAGLITFILENDFVTGSVYTMDGGRSLV